jgi:hypothetical protein
MGNTLENCPVCGLHYESEPGFFQGAMYVGYGFSVATVIACGIAVYVLGRNPEAWVYIVTTVVATLLLAPLNFRYSRVLMLYLFGGFKYDPTVAKN